LHRIGKGHVSAQQPRYLHAILRQLQTRQYTLKLKAISPRLITTIRTRSVPLLDATFGVVGSKYFAGP